MANKIIKGITIEIDGNPTKLISALRGVNATLSTTNKSLRDIDKLLKLDPTNTELLRQKQEALGTAINATKEKLEKEKLALQQMKDNNATGEVTEEQRALEREIIATEQSLRGLEDEYRQFGSVSTQQVQAVANKIGEIGGKMQTVGKAVSAVGDKLTKSLTLPLVAAGTAAAKSFADVDKVMQLTNKTMGNTADQAEMLNKAMQEAAANSTFGMSEAADATLNFARAGLSATEAASALAPAMNLAAGEGGTLETVSAGLVATINAFGDSFDNTAKYADIFAAACNNSALDIDSMSNAMAIAAPIFKAAGYSIEDAALYMGTMANAGISAEEAANALKTGIARLAKPTKEASEAMKKYGIAVFNADGTMKDSITVQRQLHDAFADMTEQEQLSAAAAIFGKNQMAKWLALINTAPSDVEALSNSLKNAAGTTEEMADAMMSGFGGSIEKLKSSLNVLMTSMGELISRAIMPLVEKLQSAVDAFNAMDDAQKEQVIQIAAVVAAIGPMLSVGGRLITTFGNIAAAIPKITTALGAMAPEVLAVVAVIGLLVAAYIKMSTYEVEVIDHTDLLTDKQKELVDSANGVLKATQDSAKAHKDSLDAIKGERDTTAKLVAELKNYTDENGRVLNSQGRVKEIVGELNALMPDLNLAYNEQTNAISMNTAEIEKNIEATLKKAELAAYEERLTEIVKERVAIEREMANMELMVAEAEQAATDAAVAYHDAQNNAKDISELSAYAYEDQKDKIDELRQAQMDAAVACSEATSPYYEMKDRLAELGAEEDDIVGKLGESSTAMAQNGDAASNMASEIGAATDEMESSWDDLYDAVERSVSSQVNLFEELKKQNTVTKDEVLKNMGDQVSNMESWSTNMQELSKRGVSEGLLQELAKMGPEGANYVAAFIQMSNEELAKASEMFERAATIPAETVSAMQSNYEQFGSELWNTWETTSNTRATAAAKENKTKGMDIGKNLGEGEVVGMKSSEGDVYKGGVTLGEKGISGAKIGAGVQSPSTFTKQIGLYIGEGLVVGLKNSIGNVVSAGKMLTQNVIQTIKNGIDTGGWIDMGKSIGSSLAAGLMAMLPEVEAAAAALIAAAEKARAGVASAMGGASGAGGKSASGASAKGFAMPNMATDNVFTAPRTTASTNNTTNTNTVNVGDITIPVYASAGQDVNAIAEAVEDILLNQITGKESVFA